MVTARAADASARPLPASVQAFLSPPRIATIGTVNADGSPHQAVVWYELGEAGLLINSRVERTWPRNLERDPRISVAVYEIERPNHWVGLKGRARQPRLGADALADIERLARRYSGHPDEYRGQRRVSFAIDVESTFEYGA